MEQSTIVLLFNIFILVYTLDENLILEYFKSKNINQITIFSCEQKVKLLELSNSLMKNNIYVSVYDLKGFNSENIENLVIKHGSQGFILNSDCDNVSTILNQCAEKELFFDKYKWLIFSQNNTILEILQDVYMNVNAEITVASKSSNNDSWSLLDVYNPGYKHGGTLKVNDLGSWTYSTGFINNNSLFTLPKYIRRKDLSELHFKGAIVLVDVPKGDLLDYLYNNESHRTIDIYSRYYFLLFTHAKDLHNFSLSIIVTPAFGTISPNGSFSGVVGALQRREADVGLTSLFYKVDRSPFVDNLVPTYLMKTRFLFRPPKPALTIGGAFFSPLDNTVWLLTWLVLLLTAVIIRVTFQTEWQLENLRNNKENAMEHDWSYIALLVFGGICQQDVPRIPNMYSGRIIVFFSVFFTYMLYQFYSGGIVSSLLSDPPITIKDLQDLLNSDLKVGVEDIVYEKMWVDENTDPLANELLKRKMRGKKNGSDAYYDEETGMNLVRKGGFAFQTDTSSGYAFMAKEFTNDEICELGEVEFVSTKRMAGVVQQDSPFRELFVYTFQRMVEPGLVHRQRIRWTTRKPECIKVVDSSTIFVGIREFFPALLFYAIGIIIAFIIFLFEIRMHSKTKKFVIIH